MVRDKKAGSVGIEILADTSTVEQNPDRLNDAFESS